MSGNWRLRAACRDESTALFFPPEWEPSVGHLAKRVCEECPVRAECFEASINEREGIWGGTSPNERREERRRRRMREAS